MSLPKGVADNAWNRTNLMKAPFIVFQSHPDDYQKMSCQSLKNVHEESVLTKVFFHPKNIDLVQKLIITEVFRRTNGEYLIEKQNMEDLQVVMRSIFIQHAKHWPYKIKEQISELNYLVADEVVPNIISEIKAYFGYLERAFGQREIMDRGISVSNKGLKTLPSVSSRFSNNE